MIELKIPRDPAVLAAVADWLTRQSAPEIGYTGLHMQLIGQASRLGEADIAKAIQQPPPEVAANAHSGDTTPVITPAQAFGAPPPPATGGTVNMNAPSPGPAPDVGEFGTEIHNVAPTLDGRGYPWDARIHSSSKALLAKPPHAWKPLRGVDPALVQAVEAEHRAQGHGKLQAPAAVTPPPPPALAASFPPSDAFLDFPSVMARVGAANKITEAQALLAAYNLPSFPALAAKPDLWPGFMQALGV
jgi:hypothetical protein